MIPPLGDEHDLVLGQHFHERHDVAGLVGAVDGDDPLPAALLHAVLVDRRALAEALLGDDEQRRVALDDDHADDRVVLRAARCPSRPSCRVPSRARRSRGSGSTGRASSRARCRSCPLVICTSISSSPSSILIALMPVERGFEYCESARLLHRAVLACRRAGTGRRVNSRTGTIAWTFVSGETLIRLTIGLPFAARPACGISCTLSQKQRPSSVKHEDVVVRRADEEVLDEILVLQPLPVEPAPAAALLAVGRDRRALDVAGVRDGDDHVLFGDQVLDRELALVARDLGAALVAVLLGDLRAARP